MTIEQKRALALAQARLRLQQQAPKTEPAQAAPVPAAPQQKYTNPLFGGVPTPQGVIEGVKGIGQSIGKLAQTKLQWEQDIPRQIKEALTGTQQPSQVSPPLMTSTGREVFEPSNSAQRAGNVIGNVGIGAGLAAATGGASLPVQVASGGLTGALMTPDSPYVGGTVGMAAPIAGAGIKAAGRYMTDKDVAAKLWNSVAKVKPGREGTALDIGAGEFKTLPGRAMVGEKGTVGNFFRALTSKPEAVQQQAAKELTSARTALASELAKSKTPIDVYANVPIDESGAFKKFADALKATDMESANLSSLTPTQANALRSDLGNRINWNPNVYNEANEALKETYFGITKNIESKMGATISPHLKRLQEALLYNKALAHEIERRASRPAVTKFIEALKRTAIPVGIGAAGVEMLRD